TTSRPALGRRSPATSRRREDLPAPFGPVTTSISPPFTTKRRSRKTSRPPRTHAKPSPAIRITAAASIFPPAGEVDCPSGVTAVGRGMAGALGQANDTDMPHHPASCHQVGRLWSPPLAGGIRQLLSSIAGDFLEGIKKSFYKPLLRSQNQPWRSGRNGLPLRW